MPVLPLVDRVLFPGLVVRLLIRRGGTDAAQDSFNTEPSKDKNDSLEGSQSVASDFIDKMGTDIEAGKKPYLACLPFPSSDNLHNQESQVWDISPQVSLNNVNNRVVCVARVVSIRKSSVFVGGVSLVLEGISRAKVSQVTFGESGIPLARVQELHESGTLSSKEKLLHNTLRITATELVGILKELNLPTVMLSQMQQLLDQTSPASLADLVVSITEADFEDKLIVLEAVDLETRLNRAIELLKAQVKLLKMAKLSQKNDLVRSKRFRGQNKPLGGSMEEEDESDLHELNKKLEELALPDDIKKITQREMRRLKRLQPAMADYQVIRNYLEWISELPWGISSVDNLDVGKARNQLSADHFGLEKVKKRILEYLAVCKLKNDVKGPILCLAGPPGVGKTSLGKSIAAAMGRKFFRISLGGVRDEAEIRGHRRTYVGAMPGLIIQGLRKCGVNNPVILLDEVDKVGANSNQGDPSAALLEVLDPEQNCSFVDHYINAPVDLSKVLFIATANRLDTIPAPLLDRMEVVELSGYTLYEKQHIAEKYLIPKHLRSHGLPQEQLNITSEGLSELILKYTREAGVRSLDREIAAVCRSKAVAFSEASESNPPAPYSSVVDTADLENILGIAKYRDEAADRKLLPGIAIGLVYTGSGSGKIMFLEASKMPGNGKLVLTGQLGEVLKESAQLALSWVKAHAYQMGITASRRDRLVDETDIHLHLPEGATPKDGPSAGVALVATLVSLFTDVALPPATAMTGEMTLRGQVLPVGGIREKVIAAHRAGIRTLLLPALNRPQVNLDDLPRQVMDDIEFHFVDTVPEALNILFKPMFKLSSSPKFSLLPNL
ncbi:hypothetical protein DSO57_1006506 [Entomophthora muscae]|uniref:Uncharacterized protein n=1 Tax=Entomophthora muscae TaxID=34485 RepID=A0ACC2S9L3_9FUNG|nr:hypothetical protein DSO57_1006506 [Entomophthora muscae]